MMMRVIISFTMIIMMMRRRRCKSKRNRSKAAIMMKIMIWRQSGFTSNCGNGDEKRKSKDEDGEDDEEDEDNERCKNSLIIMVSRDQLLGAVDRRVVTDIEGGGFNNFALLQRDQD